MSGKTERKVTKEGTHFRRSRVRFRLGLALVLAGAMVLGLWGGLKIYRVYTCANSTLTRLRALQDLVPETIAQPADLDLGEVGTQLHGLQDDLVCLRTEMREFLPLAPLFGWLPEVGPDVASAPALLNMAQAVVDGGVLVFDSLAPLIEEMEPGGSSPGERSLNLPLVVATLDAGRPTLAAAEGELQRAAELRAELDAEALSPRLGRPLTLVDRYLPLLRSGVEVAQIVPELLGAEEARTYLFLAQNDDERRPTGGWISSLGLLTIDRGQVTEVRFMDSWAVDNLEVPHDLPPEAMFRVLWAGIWLFRDANWSPDFPTSAQVAERILQRDQGIAVDGIIAVDQQALGLLVAALEPLAVGSSEEPITGANVLTFIRDSWTEPQEGLTLTSDWEEWTLHRKDFVANLVTAILNRVQTEFQNVDLTKLADAVWAGLRERHILVYLHDTEAAELLASQRWDGALLEAQGDYLQVVDANVGFNKVDPNIRRTIVYQVDLRDPGQAQAEAAVHYENLSQRAVETCLQQIEWLASYQERMHGCYWDYVRFYVPEGARLLPSEREPLPAGSLLSRYRFAPLGDAGPNAGSIEKNKTSFGFFFVLAPDEQREVRLAWQLPAGTVKENAGYWHYRLLVQKQSGTPAIPLRVTVTLPPSSRLVMAQPDPTTVQADTLAFDLSLRVDQQIEVMFEAPAVTPVAPLTSEPEPTHDESPGLYSPRQRIGFVVPRSDVEQYDVAQLGAGWYLACSNDQVAVQARGIECARSVVVSGNRYWPDTAMLREIARHDPGKLWVVGNEPDVIWQANATPQQYAQVYHNVYTALKAADPTCQVAIGGISQVTPLRLRYLEAVLAEYEETYGHSMPVDAWNIHLAILREERGSWGVDIPPGLPDDTGILYEIEDNANVELLKEQVVTFRQWMAQRGLRDTPLIVTEFGVLMPPDYGFPFERVRDFMLASFDYLMTATDDGLGYPADGYRLVQRWAWYSVADRLYPTGNLFDPNTGQMTPLGKVFTSYAVGWGR